MEIRELIEKVIKDMERDGGLKSVVWVAAGGSHDGHYAAQYFMDRESTAVRSQQITSSEFVYAAPKCVGKNTIVVLTSMRGTKETIEAAKIAKQLGILAVLKLKSVLFYAFRHIFCVFSKSEKSRYDTLCNIKSFPVCYIVCYKFSAMRGDSPIFCYMDFIFRSMES